MSDTDITDLSAFQRDLLFVIASSDDSNGLDLLAALSDYRDEEIHHGRLYPNLDDLVEMDLVDKSKQTERSNAYALTDAGRSLIESRVSWTVAQSGVDVDSGSGSTDTHATSGF